MTLVFVLFNWRNFFSRASTEMLDEQGQFRDGEQGQVMRLGCLSVAYYCMQHKYKPFPSICYIPGHSSSFVNRREHSHRQIPGTVSQLLIQTQLAAAISSISSFNHFGMIAPSLPLGAKH